MQQYPPLPCDSEASQQQDQEEQALKKEMQKEKPQKDVIMQLMRTTFQSRRHYILASSETVLQLTSNFKALAIPYVVSCMHSYHYLLLPFHHLQ